MSPTIWRSLAYQLHLPVIGAIIVDSNKKNNSVDIIMVASVTIL